MSRFRKKGKKSPPGINTSALPDIIFMLLFFFMVATTTRDQDPLVEVRKVEVPHVESLITLKQKAKLKFVYVGKKVGSDVPTPYIQLNDQFIDNPVKIQNWKKNEVDPTVDYKDVTTMFKADKSVPYKVIWELKELLRDIEANKIAYSVDEKEN